MSGCRKCGEVHGCRHSYLEYTGKKKDDRKYSKEGYLLVESPWLWLKEKKCPHCGGQV